MKKLLLALIIVANCNVALMAMDCTTSSDQKTTEEESKKSIIEEEERTATPEEFKQAIINEDIDSISWHLQNTNITQKFLNRCGLIAACQDNYKIYSLLYNQKASIYQTFQGKSALCYAIINNNTSLITLCINQYRTDKKLTKINLDFIETIAKSQSKTITPNIKTLVKQLIGQTANKTSPKKP